MLLKATVTHAAVLHQNKILAVVATQTNFDTGELYQSKRQQCMAVSACMSKLRKNIKQIETHSYIAS